MGRSTLPQVELPRSTQTRSAASQVRRSQPSTKSRAIEEQPSATPQHLLAPLARLHCPMYEPPSFPLSSSSSATIVAAASPSLRLHPLSHTHLHFLIFFTTAASFASPPPSLPHPPPPPPTLLPLLVCHRHYFLSLCLHSLPHTPLHFLIFFTVAGSTEAATYSTASPALVLLCRRRCFHRSRSQHLREKQRQDRGRNIGGDGREVDGQRRRDCGMGEEAKYLETTPARANQRSSQAKELRREPSASSQPLLARLNTRHRSLSSSVSPPPPSLPPLSTSATLPSRRHFSSSPPAPLCLHVVASLLLPRDCGELGREDLAIGSVEAGFGPPPNPRRAALAPPSSPHPLILLHCHVKPPSSSSTAVPEESHRHPCALASAMAHGVLLSWLSRYVPVGLNGL